MPTVTFLGPFYERRLPGSRNCLVRLQPLEVTQAWIDQYRSHLPSSYWRLEGDDGVTHDADGDGLPDSAWIKKDIAAWLKGQGTEVATYATKSKLLDLVASTLAPPAPEELAPEEVETESILVEDDTTLIER